MRARHRWKLQMQVPQASDGAQPAGPWLTPRDRAHVQTLCRRWGLLEGSQPLIVICPGARSHIKRWTAEGFARVADRLIQDDQAHVIFSGEPEEEPIVEEILGLMDHQARSAVGLVTLRQLGVLMQRAALVITNDSAALHLASAVEVPTVALLGPTDPDKYGPTVGRHRTIRRRLFCAPCEQPQCRFHH